MFRKSQARIVIIAFSSEVRLEGYFQKRSLPISISENSRSVCNIPCWALRAYFETDSEGYLIV